MLAGYVRLTCPIEVPGGRGPRPFTELAGQ
jgi:hypothetical protein